MQTKYKLYIDKIYQILAPNFGFIQSLEIVNIIILKGRN